MARGKGGLGRGLDSLFEDAAPVFESGAKVDTLPLREIEPDPEQPRKTFDEQALGELAASIAEHGLLQPIAVRPRPRGGYSIVAGERRWRACRMAGLNDVPVVIKEVSDEQAMELALVENLQREDLDPVEEATGIRELMTRCGLTQEQAAQNIVRDSQNVQTPVAEPETQEPVQPEEQPETDADLDDAIRDLEETPLPEEAREELENVDNKDMILEMHKAGLSILEIAKHLGLGVGEVKLVVDLYQGEAK